VLPAGEAGKERVYCVLGGRKAPVLLQQQPPILSKKALPSSAKNALGPPTFCKVFNIPAKIRCVFYQTVIAIKYLKIGFDLR
jgi:hypothetical protein